MVSEEDDDFQPDRKRLRTPEQKVLSRLNSPHKILMDTYSTHKDQVKMLFILIKVEPFLESVPQSCKRQRLEQGVIFIDDDSEPENVTPGPLSWKNSQKAGITSPCCVSDITVITPKCACWYLSRDQKISTLITHPNDSGAKLYYHRLRALNVFTLNDSDTNENDVRKVWCHFFLIFILGDFYYHSNLVYYFLSKSWWS